MTLARRPGPSSRTRVTELRGDQRVQHEDRLATEEPLEIRIASPGVPARRAGVTMRTPGHDFELAAGWLVHEGITLPGHVETVRYCTDVHLEPEQEFNVVTVDLAAPPLVEPDARLVSSACGVCGKDSIGEALRPSRSHLSAGLTAADIIVAADTVRSLPEALRAEQAGFERTGGLHAAGLFDVDGTRVVVREDVGRHNAVDKVVGSRVLGRLPVPPVLVLSGRIGFELVQKAVVAGVSVVVAVGAPSSLAVRLATEAGLTVVGFTRPDRCVVYAGADRIGV
ncbi:MAG TPA: formate dehydrogenase accessory sulfurtransferase FdhD [Marmoricola sp.]|nr:formate dehydrogenase accessory sulfurtransferase FdhD [Marmoricola sp.]